MLSILRIRISLVLLLCLLLASFTSWGLPVATAFAAEAGLRAPDPTEDEESDDAEDEEDAEADEEADENEEDKKENEDKEPAPEVEVKEADLDELKEAIIKARQDAEGGVSDAERKRIDDELKRLQQAAIKSKKPGDKTPAVPAKPQPNMGKQPAPGKAEPKGNDQAKGGKPTRPQTKPKLDDQDDPSAEEGEGDDAEDASLSPAERRRKRLEEQRQRRLERIRNSKSKNVEKTRTGGKDESSGRTSTNARRPQMNTRKPRGTRPASSVDNGDEADSDSAAGVGSPVGELAEVMIIDIETRDGSNTASITFNPEDMPWMDIVRDLARIRGVPYIDNPDALLEGNLTYFTTKTFTYRELFNKLNELLLDQPLNNMIIRDLGDRITVERIPDAMRKIPVEKIFGTYAEFEAADLPLYDICVTQFKAPEGWTAGLLIDEFRPEFSDTYGVEPLDQYTIQLTGLVKEHYEFRDRINRLTSVIEPPGPGLGEEAPTKVELKHVKAADMQTLLRQLYPVDAASTAAPTAANNRRRGRRGRNQAASNIAPELEDTDAISIIVDAINNVLYIHAPDRYMSAMLTTIRNIDVPVSSPPRIESVQVNNAPAEDVVNLIAPLLATMKQDLAGDKRTGYVDPKILEVFDVTLRAASGNSIIMVGGAEGNKEARRLIAQYDVQPDWINRTFILQHRDATDIVEEVQNALPPAMGAPVVRASRAKKGAAAPASGGSAGPDPVFVIRSSRELYVSATRFDMDRIAERVAEFDRPDPDAPTERFVEFTCAIPSEVADTLAQLLRDDGSGPQVVEAKGKGKAKTAAQRRAQARARAKGRSTSSGGDGPVMIAKDAESRLLILCSDQDWAEMKPLIDELEKNACEIEPIFVEIPLENADPTDLASTLNQMFPANSGEDLMITADAFNKRIRMWAKPAFIEKVQPLIAKLDINVGAEMTVIRLEYSKAELIAPIIKQAIPGTVYQAPNIRSRRTGNRRDNNKKKNVKRAAATVKTEGETTVTVTAEPFTNSLLVTAPPEKLEQIQRLVADIEAEAKENAPYTETITVKNRKAEDLATVLKSILATPTTAPGGKGGGKVEGINAADVELAITAIGERLIIAGPRKEVDEAIKLTFELDVADPEPIIRKVQAYDAEEDKKKLEQLLSGVESTEVQVVTANSNDQKAAAARGRRTRTRQPQKAKLSNKSAIDDVEIVADTFENTLIIRALPKDWPLIEQCLAIIYGDSESVGTDEDAQGRDGFFVYELRDRDAWDISYDLDTFLNTDGRRPIEFLEGPQEKMLIVRNYRPDEVDKIKEIIRMWDVPKDGSGSAGDGWIQLDLEGKISPEAMARLLQLRHQSSVPIEVGDLGGISRVEIIDIHAGDDEDDGKVEIKKTRAGDKKKSSAKVNEKKDETPVSSLTPTALPLWLQQVAAVTVLGQTPEDENPASPLANPRLQAVINAPVDRIRIFPDPETGHVIITGPQDELIKLEELATELIPDKATTVIRVFPMKYADVRSAAQLLNDVFNQPAQRRAPQRRQPQQNKGGEKGGDEARAKALAQAQAQAQAQQQAQQQSLASARIKVVPDERTSSLYVVAPLPDIPLIVEVLKRIDSKDIPPPLDFRMFELKELDATQVVENLKDVLGINQARTAARGRTPQRGNNRNQRGNQQNRQVQLQQAGGDATTIAADKTKLTAVTQTNTIIAQGPTPTLDMIAKIIDDLESLKIVDVEVRPVKLEHARASEIAEIAQNLIDETINSSGPQAAPAGGRGRGRGRAAPAASANKENVSSHADTRTNSIILVGPSNELDRAMEIVKSFDVDITGIVFKQIPVNGDPREIATTLRELFQVPSGRGSEANDIVITPLEATSTVIVKAPAPQMAEIEKEIETINASIGETKEWRTIELTVADAETVAESLNQLFGGSTRRGGTTSKIKIKGFSASSIIYVQAPEETFKEMQIIAQKLDQVDASMGTVTRFELKHAAAQQVLGIIRGMMAQAMSSSDMTASIDYVSLEADPRTNSLVLVGGPKSQLILNNALAQLDVEESTPLQKSQQTYKLPTNVDVNQVVRNINEMFRNEDVRTTGREKPVVTANPGANLVIVDANKDQHERIKALVDEVSKGGQEGERKRHLYALEHAKAPDLARVLNDYIRNNFDQVNRKYPITVLAEEGTNSLIVNSSEEDYAGRAAEGDKPATEGFKDLIESLDQPGAERKTKVFRVKYVSPWSLANIINTQFRSRSRNPNDQVTAAFEDGTYSIIVTANDANMTEVENLITASDMPKDVQSTEYVKLEHGQADEMRNSIDQALRGRYPTDRRGQPPFTITANGLSNQLVISAPENIMPDILEMISMFDIPGAKEKIRKVFKLKFVDPGAVSRMVQQLFRAPRGNYSPNESVESTDDWTTNSVIVSANPEKMKEIEDLINELDQVGDGPRTERVITVKNADPNDVAQTIQQIFQQASSGRRGQAQSPVLRAVRGSNKMIAFANDKEFAQIEALVKAIDEEGSRAITAMVMEPRIPVRSVAESINNLYGGGGRGRGNNEGPRAEYHEPTNTLFVYATDDEYEKIERDIITPVSTATPVEAQMHFIKVKNAVAEDVATTLQDFFDKKIGLTSGRGRGFFGGRGGGGQANTDEDRIVINADAQSNTLIVYCTDKVREEIDQLLAVIDSETAEERMVEMVALQHVSPDVMIEILTEVLRVNRGSAGDDQRDLPWWARDNDDDEDDTVLAGDTRLKAINETNSIIVAGKPESVENALKEIEKIDVPGANSLRYLKLTCADATIIAEQAEELVADSNTTSSRSSNRNRGRGRGRGRNNASSGGTAPELSIIASQATNTLIIRGRTSDVNEVVAFAEQMDADYCEQGDKGIKLIPIPSGYSADELATLIEETVNEAEQKRNQANSSYVPDLVTLRPNVRTNTILASASATKMDEINLLIEGLSDPSKSGGGYVRDVVRVKPGNTEDIKQLIEELIQNQENQGSSSRGRSNRGRGNRGRGNRGGGNRGRRGDANWTHNRRYEAVESAAREDMQPATKATGEKKQKMIRTTTIAATLPVLMMNVALQSAVAQTDKPNDANKDKPRSIRLRRPPKRDEKKDDDAKKSDGGKKAERDKNNARGRDGNNQAGRRRIAPPRGRDNDQPQGNDRRAPNTGRNEQPREMSPELKRMIEARARQNQTNVDENSLDAISARLSGTPISVIEAPDGSLIIEGLEDDVQILTNIIQMIDAGTPEKDVDFILLKNALAQDVADRLNEVFSAIEPENARPVDKVEFIADKRANAIFIAASPDNLSFAKTLVNKVDTPSQIEKETKTFAFANRRVLEVGETMKTIAQNYLRQKGLETNQIQIEIDAPTNQIVVSALEADMKFIENIVKNLDVDMGDEEAAEKFGNIGSADIMVVPLRHTGADELATLINLLLERAATGDTPLKDFIRRFRLLDENGEPLATVNLDRPTLVFGEPESNSLIIASSIENCMVMRQVAMALDKEATKDPVEMQTVPLTFADASEVATKLSEMLDASAGLTEKPAGGGDPGGVPDGRAGAIVYKAIVKADARTNQVVVVGRPDTVEILTGLIAKLDIEGRGVMPFEIVKLNHAQATGLAEALTDLMDRRKEAIPMGEGANAEKSETVVIVADARSESLILAAKRERLSELKELIEKLDVPATALIDNIRTIKVVNGIATDLADKLQELWDQRQQNEGGGDSGLTFDKPAIVADERSNSLIVVASESDYESIKTVVEKIDNLELNPAAGIYIVQLKHNSASELAGPLTNLFQARAENRGLQEPRPEDKVTIEADPATNSLIFVASKENHDILMDQLGKLDRPIGVEAVIEFFPCENVFASSVKDALDNLFPDVFKDRVGEGAVNENRETLSVVVDERANMLIVSASPENMEIVRRVYSRMNSVAEPWTPVDFEIVRLEHTESKVIASQLESALEDVGQQSGGGSGGSGSSGNQFQVKVLSDPVRNSVIIGGTRDGIRLAMKLIRDLDRPVNMKDRPSYWVEDYKLNQARAGNVGEMLTNIFQARREADSEGGDTGATPTPVTIEINEPGNSLLVNANSQDHALISGLIAQLDRSSVIDTMFRVFPLSKAKAETVKEILDEIYQGSVSDGASGGAGNTITTVAEERTNSIVVAVPPGELENIESLVNKLDSVQIKETALVEVIRCDNEDASKMAELLNEIMTGQAAEGGGGANADSESARALSSLLIQYTAKDEYGNRDILQTVRENVQITYNERSNSVIVVAPPTSMSLIKKLVRELDSIEKREVMVRVFLLNNADATAMVELLDEMFAQDEGSDDQAAFQQGRQINVEGGLSDGSGGPGFLNAGNSRRGTFGRPRTTFVPDERTNAIIVAGWPEDIDVAGDIIAQLDSRDIQERVNVVYPLVNTRAEELQGSLDTYFAAQRELISSQNDVSQLAINERDVTVVAHEESNQLMVSTSPRYQAEVLRIIQQLDAPPPQVMIEVMIAEVSLDDSFEMGLEFALQQLKFSESAVPGPNGIIQSNSFDFIGGTDLGAAGAGLGGFSFTITGEDFNFLVRALQTDSRLEVIQRPSIMCQTNQEANITIGENVPFVRGTTVSDAGNTSAQVEYEEVGVILNVEPVINPDGFVYLRVAPEISSVSNSNIPLGNGIFAPIITQQSAETTVAVKDGETVVIGGLITSSNTEAESKVPGLGDIPGLGGLFRTTTRSSTRSELLIALTPTIVRSVEDARRMSVDQRDLAGVITPDMKASPIFRQLQVTPETGSEIDSIEVRPNNGTPLDPPSATPVRPRTIPSYQPDGMPRYGPVVQPAPRQRSTTPPPTYRPTIRTNPVSRPSSMERMVPVNAPAQPRSVPVHTANRRSSSSSSIPSRVAGTSSTNNMQPVATQDSERRVQKVRTAPDPQPSTTPQRNTPPKRPLYGPSPVVRVTKTPVRKVSVRTTPTTRDEDARESEEDAKRKRKPRATHR